MNWQSETLPYLTEPGAWLRLLHAEPYAFALQSAGASGQRFDIFGANPRTILMSRDGRTIRHERGLESEIDATIFDAVEAELAHCPPEQPCPYDLPFDGGAVGYFGYELAHGLETLPAPCEDKLDLPAAVVGIYNWFVINDHDNGTSRLIATPDVTGAEFARVRELLNGRVPEATGFVQVAPIISSFSRSGYDQAIGRIKDYIEDGDCYQVNLAQRFETRIEGDPLAVYESILAEQKPPYAAYLASPAGTVLSFSPERFIRVKGGMVTTQPIKGTRPRGTTTAEDLKLANQLLESDKDRAENLMIVDLLRNDLGKCCTPGSIRVTKLFDLESFPNVHHLVSTITGQLQDGISPLALVKAAFPGGSITGAPKIRAMEIIRELETCRRGPYCGAIGYYGYNGNLDTNLSIRTMAITQGDTYYWGGGGIVADSTADSEYEESLAKVDFIRRVLSRTLGQSALAAQNNR